MSASTLGQAQRKPGSGTARTIMDGNEAAASASYRLNELCSIYPITPSSTMAELADVPTHVMVGTKDRLTPVRWARRLHDGIPGSRLTVLPGKGHMLTHEATDTVADALIELIDQG